MATSITIDVPVKTVSEKNRREHWSKRDRRVRAQKEIVWVYLARAAALRLFIAATREQELAIRLVRIAPRLLDAGDNDAVALSAVRDTVAKMFGRDDGASGRITWTYGQEKAKTYGVRVEVQTVPR